MFRPCAGPATIDRSPSDAVAGERCSSRGAERGEHELHPVPEYPRSCRTALPCCIRRVAPLPHSSGQCDRRGLFRESRRVRPPGDAGNGAPFSLRFPFRPVGRGEWGRLDVDDTAAMLRASHDRGWSAPARTVMMGSSSGGLTALGVLGLHHGPGGGGVVLYPGDRSRRARRGQPPLRGPLHRLARRAAGRRVEVPRALPDRIRRSHRRAAARDARRRRIRSCRSRRRWRSSSACATGAATSSWS